MFPAPGKPCRQGRSGPSNCAKSALTSIPMGFSRLRTSQFLDRSMIKAQDAISASKTLDRLIPPRRLQPVASKDHRGQNFSRFESRPRCNSTIASPIFKLIV